MGENIEEFHSSIKNSPRVTLKEPTLIQNEIRKLAKSTSEAGIQN